VGVPCLEKATDLLARRSHFRAQLRAKLAARGYPDDEIEAALDRLAELGYLDDGKTAAELVTLRRGRGEGRRRIEAELQRRGATAEAIEAALAELPRDDLPEARESAELWRRKRGRGTDLRALGRHLDRKGFTRHAILTILEELGAFDPAGDEEPDEGDGPV